MKVAVVILAYNNAKFLTEFLPSVIEYSKEADLWVIDNASSDNSAEIMEGFPLVEYRRLDTNLGFAGGYNEGLKSIEADYFVLLNSDVEVSEDWLKPLIALAKEDPKVGAIQPKIKSYHDKSSFEYAGAAGGVLDKMGYPFCRGRIFGDVEKDTGQYDTRAKVFWATGACMFIKADLYKSLGGLDDSFFAHMEEIDLCWRIQRAGYDIYVEPSSTVYHVGGGTLANDNPRKTYLNFRNNLAMIYRNHPHYRSMVLFKLLLDGLAAFRFVMRLEFKHVFSILNAHIDFYRDFKATKARKKTFNEKIESNRIGEENIDGWYTKSIVASFFLHGKKKYSDLDF